jgi:hypothetical protein
MKFGESHRVPDTRLNGIRYHPPASYVLIKPDYENSGVKVETITVPDPTRTLTIRPYSTWANNTSLIEFDRGMLKRISNTADTTKVAKSLITEATEIAKSALAIASQQAELNAAKHQAARAAEETRAGSGDCPPVWLFLVQGNRLRRVFGPEDWPRVRSTGTTRSRRRCCQ